MFQLNPNELPNAWWQHMLMLLVAGIVGYIIGHRSGNRTVEDLQKQIDRIAGELEICKKSLISFVPVTSARVLSDDLKIIEGIGPKIEKLLNVSGISTFRQLSETRVESLKEILENAGPKFRMHQPDTWPRQARLAADGEWETLKAWQDELDGGIA